MSLASGTRLGPYEIVAPIGAGGMGEVYRAKDTNLDREVAIKVLPGSFALDADRVARFTREAKTLASLNHPNIAAIYGLVDLPPEGGSHVHALVMELVEGEDLSAHIARGAMPLAETLPIAKQIADALDAAHEQGIVHRDLKPANIKVRADGTVKVLDFGLAKAMDPGGGSAVDAANSPTLTRATQLGVILGTAAYMAPEQARGKSVDKRADIWAFGVVLYEMLTGRRAFEGDETSDLLAAVLRQEIDFTALPADTPASVRRLTARCLDRDLKRRLRDIGEARVVLENPVSPLVSDPPPVRAIVDAPPAVRAQRWTRAVPWAIAAATTVIAIGLWAPWRAAPAPTVLKLTPLSFEQGGQTALVWSPDGKAVAFGARQKDTDPYQLYVRYLDSPVATKITSTAAGVSGVVEWTTAGRIIFVSPGQVWSVSPVGGEPEPFGMDIGAKGATLVFSAPSVTRDGTALAGVFRGGDGVVNIWTAASSHAALEPYKPSPFAARTFFTGINVKFSPDGRQLLLFQDIGVDGVQAWLMPYPGNAANPPRRILQGILRARRPPAFSWMPDSRHVVMSAAFGGGVEQLYLADTVSGTLAVLFSGTRAQVAPAVSPDGSRLAFLESTTDYDVVSLDLASAAVTPIIATERSEQQPAWAARDTAMVYVTDRNGASEIWWHKEGLTDRPIVTARDFPPGTVAAFATPTLSPDGTRVIYRLVTTARFGGLWISAVAGGAPVRLTKGPPPRESLGSWSPDGSWFVYMSDENGHESLNKVKTTGEATPVVLKADVKRQSAWGAVWSPAGDWILSDDDGVKLISPDGKTARDVSPTSALTYAFSADGRTLYGLRQSAPASRVELFSMSVAGGPEKIIGSLSPDARPASDTNPGLRLSLAPDGKRLTYSTARATSNLWLMDGLKPVTVR